MARQASSAIVTSSTTETRAAACIPPTMSPDESAEDRDADGTAGLTRRIGHRRRHPGETALDAAQHGADHRRDAGAHSGRHQDERRQRQPIGAGRAEQQEEREAERIDQEARDHRDRTPNRPTTQPLTRLTATNVAIIGR